MASSTTGMTITLKTKDGEEFVVSEMVAMQSKTIRHLIEDDCAQNTIPLPNVSAKILAQVIEFCKIHAEAADASKNNTTGEGTSSTSTSSKMSEEELKKWDREFVDVDLNTLYDLILAANYLDIRKLLDATCQKAADMIKGKNPEEIRQTFNIENDFTPEEEEEIRRENQWAFE